MAQEIKKINGVYMGSQEIASTRFVSDANLKAYYRFNTGALTTDSSEGGHTLTALGDPAEGTGKFGGGVDLDGNDAYSASDHADFKPTGVFSLGCWFKTSNAGAQVFFQSQSQNTNVAGYILYINAGNIVFQSGKNSGTTYHTDYESISSTLSTYADGVWHNVIGVSDGTNLRLYVDGLVAKTAVAWANAPAYAATNYVRVGCYNVSGSDSLYLTGSLDDLFLLNGTALTSDEIYSLYKTGVKKLNGVVNLNPELESTSLRGDANLVQYTKFEGNSTATVGSNGTDTAITYGTSYGKFGQGALFNGSTSNIALTDSSSLKQTGNFSISCWINFTGTYAGTTPEFFQSFSYPSSKYAGIRFGLDYSNGKFLRFDSGNNTGSTGGVNYGSAVGTRTINDGIWHNVVAVWNGTLLLVYVDGTLDNSVSWANAPAYAATNYVRIGCGNNTGTNQDFYNGKLDDLAIFSRALTAQEISNLYNTNIKKYMGVTNI